MTEFEINGVQYRAQTMDARQQFHVARRIISMLVPPEGVADKDKGDKDGIIAALDGFADKLSTLPDAQLDYVIDACLDIVSRKDGGTWSPIRRAGAMMYDLDLYTLGAIVYHVVRRQLGGFFASLPAPVRDMLKGIMAQGMGQAMEPAQPSGD